jgi:hypothetical protein
MSSLSGIGPARTDALSQTRSPRDERAGLVYELADLFALPPSHRAEDIAVFEELMTSLYAKSPAGERRHASERLARRADLPGSIAGMIAADDIDIALSMLTHSPALSTIDRIRIIGNRSEAHRAAIAGRPDLEDAVISALLLHGGSETVAALGANAQAALSPGQIDRLIERVIEGGRTIETLSTTLGLGPARRIDIFFELAPHDRRNALIAFDRDVAFSRIEKRGRRTPPPLRADFPRRLIDAVFSGDSPTYATLVADALGISAALSHRIIEDKGGEPLVIALMAAGLDATDATSILVRSDPALGWTYYTIRDLVRVYEAIGWRTAEAVIARWAAIAGWRPTTALRQTDASERHVPGERRVGGPQSASMPRPSAMPGERG